MSQENPEPRRKTNTERGEHPAADGGSATGTGSAPATPADPHTRGPGPRRALPALAGALVLALAVGGCGDSDSGGSDDSGSAEPDLKVSGAYIPQPLMEDMAGGFLTVSNTGNQADRLTSVSSDISRKVELHRTQGQKMQQTPSLKVPANGELKLERGGNHLMLIDLEKKPAKGDTVTVVLNFEKSGKKRVEVPVKATNHTPENSGKSGHSQHSGGTQKSSGFQNPSDSQNPSNSQKSSDSQKSSGSQDSGHARAAGHSAHSGSGDTEPRGAPGRLDDQRKGDQRKDEQRKPVGSGEPAHSGTSHR